MKDCHGKRRKLKLGSHLLQSLAEYGTHTSIHGISYILDKSKSLSDKLVWILIFIASTGLAIFLIASSYMEWQENLVITSLKTVTKPIADLTFPSVTVCPAGQHLDTVEKVLYKDFLKWEKNRKGTREKKNLKEKWEDYMREVFQIKDKGIDIMDLLSTMISPSENGGNANAVRKNQLACEENKGRVKRLSNFVGKFLVPSTISLSIIAITRMRAGDGQ